MGSGYVYCNKVEICGANTSKLPVLKEKKDWTSQKSRQGTNRQGKNWFPATCGWCSVWCRNFSNRGEILMTCFQVGCIGLMKAIDNFNPELDVRFSTYGAVLMIVGEIRRFCGITMQSVPVVRCGIWLIGRCGAKENFIHEFGENLPSRRLQKLECKKKRVVLALESVVDPLFLHMSRSIQMGEIPFLWWIRWEIPMTTGIGWRDQSARCHPLPGREGKEDSDLALLAGRTQTEVAQEIGILKHRCHVWKKSALERIKGQMREGLNSRFRGGDMIQNVVGKATKGWTIKTMLSSIMLSLSGHVRKMRQSFWNLQRQSGHRPITWPMVQRSRSQCGQEADFLKGLYDSQKEIFWLPKLMEKLSVQQTLQPLQEATGYLTAGKLEYRWKNLCGDRGIATILMQRLIDFAKIRRR